MGRAKTENPSNLIKVMKPQVWEAQAGLGNT
jgi:hypothetical protein